MAAAPRKTGRKPRQPEKKPVKRIRRDPQEARRLILDAAEASMASAGPAGIRLQDVARAAGVSHPTILHHFGSRENLIHALNRRAVEDLKTALLEAMTASSRSGQNAVALSFAAYRNGLAQRVLWALQAPPLPGDTGVPVFEEIVQTLHKRRLQLAAPGIPVDIFDSRAIIHLTTIAAFGDAIIGPRLRRAGRREEQMRGQFEEWLGNLVTAYVRKLAGA
jgi:AcrR family transcriptional regulator